MNAIDFKLTLATRAPGGATVECAVYLDAHSSGSQRWLPRDSKATMRLTIGGRERIGSVWAWDELRLAVRQLELARRRLSAGRVAFLRSGNSDERGVLWMLLNPAHEGAAGLSRLSLVRVTAPEWKCLCPGQRRGQSDERLAGYFERAQPALIGRSLHTGAIDPEQIDMPFPQARLLRDLDSAVAVGRQVLALTAHVKHYPLRSAPMSLDMRRHYLCSPWGAFRLSSAAVGAKG